MVEENGVLKECTPVQKEPASPLASQASHPRFRHSVQGSTVFMKKSFKHKPAQPLSKDEVNGKARPACFAALSDVAVDKVT